MIVSHVTNGFGNNIFQCVAGKILAEHHETEHYFITETPDYECKKYLEILGFKILPKKYFNNNFLFINDSTYTLSFDKSLKGKDIYLKGYFENKDYYENRRQKILDWFPNIAATRNTEDLVFHFRTGDRLFYKNEFDSKPQPDNFKKAIESFDFKNLYIVTDMYDWRKHTIDSFKDLKFHVEVEKEKSVDTNVALDYFNSCFDMLQSFNPKIVNGNVLEDFRFIRTFDQILFQHGTMSWWAAFLSRASKVGVYGPWRPWKGISNKNLSEIKLDGWFKWN